MKLGNLFVSIEISVIYFAGGDYSRPYIDVKDAQWLCHGDLQPVDANSVTPSQFVIYRFGVFVTRMLRQHIDTPEVRILFHFSVLCHL